MDKESKEVKEKSIETDPFVGLIKTAQSWKLDVLAKQARSIIENRDTIVSIGIDPEILTYGEREQIQKNKPRNILEATSLCITVDLKSKRNGAVFTYRKRIRALTEQDDTNPEVFYGGQWNSFLKLFSGWLATAQDSSILITRK